MEPDFWHERWRAGQIAFHQTQVDRSLQRHWHTLGLGLRSRVFVPLCGKSLDLLWLRDQGHVAVGVELSTVAVQAFCMENGIPARRRIKPRFDLYEAPNLELMCGDFFAVTADDLNPLAAVYDRAALIAWAPELRDAYVDRMAELVTAGTETLLIALEYEQAQMKGPPFAVLPAEVERLYGSRFAIRELARDDILPNEPRFQARGVTALHEACYRLTRL